MVTKLDKFKERMEPAKELYTREIRNFAKRYDCLGEMTVIEEPDIDTQEYIYSFENLNGTSQDELDDIALEISDYMDEFSKSNSIEFFSRNVIIWI